MAQEVINNPGYCAQFYPNANCQNKGPGNPYTGSYQRQLESQRYRDGNAAWDNGRNDRRSYDNGTYNNGTYDNGYNGGSNQSYAERNGSVCTPGTWFKGEDGRRHRCQKADAFSTNRKGGLANGGRLFPCPIML